MKLINCILRPGRVLSINEDGSITADVPGLFSSIDKDKLPPIYPFLNNNSGNYSKPSVFDEVWILNNKDNPLQLYWFRKNTLEIPTDINIEDETVEIICNKEIGPNNWANIYFSNGTGWILGCNGSSIQIDSNGNIKFKTDTPHRSISISPTSISLGSDQSNHPLVYGDILKDLLLDICSMLEVTAMVGQSNPYTLPMAQMINQNISKIKTKISEITSPHVMID